MTNKIPAPTRLALEMVIEQYDSTQDINQLIEDIAVICVVTESTEKVYRNSQEIKEKYFPGLVKEEKERIKNGLCPNCGQPLPKRYWEIEKVMQHTMDMEESD